jgi:hypothetical protein
MISPFSCLKGEDPVEESSINTGLQAGVIRLKWKRAVFNGLPRPSCIQRCGLRRHHEKAVETA